MEYPAGGGAAARPGQMTVSCPIIIIPAAKSKSFPRKDANGGTAMKILVVDDEKTIVKGIKFNLENEGYQVDVCYDGETAVDMARRGEYAVILLDLMMPKLDGLAVLRRLEETAVLARTALLRRMRS